MKSLRLRDDSDVYLRVRLEAVPDEGATAAAVAPVVGDGARALVERALRAALDAFLGAAQPAAVVLACTVDAARVAAGGAALLASAATDRRVMLWDITRIGDEQSADDANDGPPELVFVHSGHTAGVAEFAPCPAAPWTVASVDSDNALQVWQPAANIRAPDDLSRPPSDAAIADLE